jgi:putative addiction module component (TIGR02574 family)
MNIETLSTSEKILLAQELWESVHSAASEAPLSKAQKAILNNRLATLASDENLGDTWENVKRRITQA